ncbi:NAD(P)H-binding protein [Rhodococcus aerolatus]
MRIVVAGGTGAVGAPLVSQLEAAGHEAVIIARTHGLDVLGKADLPALLTGADAVVDVTNRRDPRKGASEAFFGGVTRALLAAGEQTGVRHHVALSVVGVDGLGLGYYAGKRRQEQLLRESSAGWTVLRATQLHEFATQVARQGAVGPVSFVPKVRCAPVAAEEVAAALLELATGEPRREVLEMAGPREEQLGDMARRAVRRRGSGRRVVVLPVPGGPGRGLSDGTLLPGDPWRTGSTTFEEWLAA